MKKNILIVALLLLAGDAGRYAATPAMNPSPLFFEENFGQAPREVSFLARGHGYNLLLTAEGNQLTLRHDGQAVSLRTTIVNANSNAVIRGEGKQPGKIHYLGGGRPLANIPTYARVRYDRIYSGIDLVYYGNESRLEYDFIVRSGANPDSIAMRFEGADEITLDASGNLILRSSMSELVQHKPVVYQTIDGERRAVQGSYKFETRDTVGFEIGAYNRDHDLIIDPVLSYSTYIGGSNGDDDARAIVTDATGAIYFAGSTTSTNFQTAAPLQGNAGNNDPELDFSDAFITKLNPAGTALVYSTYLGGTSNDAANAIAVDSSGNVIVAGFTSSTDFTTTSGAISRQCSATTGGGCLDVFVAKISPSGGALVFSTYLGGNGDDEAQAIAVDAGGNAYVAGSTTSTNFPTTSGALSTNSAGRAFVTKLSSSGATVYSTYYSAGTGATEIRGIAVDSSGSAYITGSTPSSTTTATDLFVTKLNAGGSAAAYSQFIRGAKDDSGNAIAVDASGNAYVTGSTSSVNFTVTSGVVQSGFAGGPAFRSSNAGTDWTAGNTGITANSLHALAIAQTTPATLYAGADDEISGGLFRSTDGGATWSSAASGITDARIHAIAVDPTSPTTVYAGSRTNGVFKSTNGGTGWSGTALNNVFVTAIVVDPVTPATVFAGTAEHGIFKSTNGGASWTTVHNAQNVRTLAISPSTPATIYAGTGAGIYTTTNGGSSWVSTSSGLFDPNINVLVIDPRNPNTLYAATNSVGVFRSVNAGSFWLFANGGLTSSSLGILVTALTIDANGVLYAAIGEGNVSRVYKSTNGTSWTPTSLTTSRMTSLAVDRNTLNSIYAATVGGTDAFVAKWNAGGTLVYSTLLGGRRDDAGNAIAVDAGGNVYVAGNTSSTEFPVVAAMQSTFGGGTDVVTDAFVAKINSIGAALTYSSYVGGESNDFAKGIAVDSSGNAYVAGQTGSSLFPTAQPVTATRPGLLDAFVAKIADTSTVSYSFAARGGSSLISQGAGASAITSGYARIQAGSGTNTPSGLAIFGVRQNNALISEAAVPASTLITSGRIYAEAGGGVDTGLAIANPNSQAVTVTFYFTNSSGASSAAATTSVGANSQIAYFLSGAPFNGGSSFDGTFTFTSSAPVSAIALRGFTNELGEFLITTLPVADLSVAAGAESILFPHFADGGGWVTHVVLVNPTDDVLAGSIQFSASVTVDGQAGTNFTYSIPAKSSRRFRTSGVGTATQSGSVRVTPNTSNRTPSGLGIFTFKPAGVTVSEAGVPAIRAGNAFRLYAESSGNFAASAVGSIQTGVAIANPSSSPATVTFELTTLSGASTGLTGTETVPANGQIAKFLSSIQGFGNVPNPFQGVLRISSSVSGGVAVVGLRARYNERNSFLITTTSPVTESAAASSAEQFFPHFADGGGYTTQFILFNGVTDQSSSGSLRFFNQAGQPLSLSVR